jgi:hypothetical protein
MGNTTNNSFEDQWQKAFDDAIMPPSEAVWERIELGLQNSIQPKLNNGSYYFGAILAIILGVGLWFYMRSNEEKKQVQIVDNKDIIIESKEEKSLPKEEKKVYVKPKYQKVLIAEKEELKEPFSDPKTITQILENQERILADSIDFMSPIIVTQKVNSELVNPSINISFEQTPYYEIPKPKSKKNSIWDKVRISGGIGVYQ